MIRLGARGYNPTIGRFDRVDPVIEEQEQFSLYQYGWNNPVLRIDPDGNLSFPAALPFLPEIVAGATALGEAIAATTVGVAIGAGIKKLVESGVGQGVGAYNPALGLAMSTSKPGELTGLYSRKLNSTSKAASSNSSSNASSGASASGTANPSGSKKSGYTPKEELPRKKDGTPKSDKDASGPHTQLGTKKGSKGDYKQAREFDKNGNPVKDIDFTDHGRPKEHTNPDEHKYVPNNTGGTMKRGSAEPLNKKNNE
ncbi:hypothetical protein C0V77_22680 [Emticicia sp. TH156]|nr:hypothetical protein C0V77_22680 [Emticicia sp. TH156]